MSCTLLQAPTTEKTMSRLPSVELFYGHRTEGAALHLDDRPDMRLPPRRHTCSIRRDGGSPVAYLTVHEFPVDAMSAVSWARWLPQVAPRLGRVGLVASSILDWNYVMEDPENDSELLERGSLFVLEDLRVAPSWQGERLGRRLVEEALRTLKRSDADVVVCGISLDDPAADSLIEYAEAMGFDRSPVLWNEAEEGTVWMHRLLRDLDA